MLILFESQNIGLERTLDDKISVSRTSKTGSYALYSYGFTRKGIFIASQLPLHWSSFSPELFLYRKMVRVHLGLFCNILSWCSLQL